MLPARLRVRPTTLATDRPREKSRRDFPIDFTERQLLNQFDVANRYRKGKIMEPVTFTTVTVVILGVCVVIILVCVVYIAVKVSGK